MKTRMFFAGLFALALSLARLSAAENIGYDPDENGFIRNWLFLLPAISLNEDVSEHLEDQQKPFLEKEFFKGQKTVKPAEGDKLKIGENELSWIAIGAGDAILFLDPPRNNSIYFGVVYVMAKQDIPELTLSIGSDDSSLWRLNGEEVIREYMGRKVAQDQNTSKPLTLKKGVNVLSVSVINGIGVVGVCARFLDKDNNPVKGLKVFTSIPPGATVVPQAVPPAPEGSSSPTPAEKATDTKLQSKG